MTYDDRDSQLMHGLVITAFKDREGPDNIFNSSPLNDEEAFNMTLKTLTVLGTDIPQSPGEIRTYGPIPTLREPYTSLAFIFTLESQTSTDPRIALFGRLFVIWIITSNPSITKYRGLITSMIRRAFHIYGVKTDNDLYRKDTIVKIYEKLRNIEAGIETYYIPEEGKIETFTELFLIPPNAPIVLVDNPNKQINVLLREESAGRKKIEILQLVNDHKRKIPKGSLYKVEMIEHDLTIQRLLSLAGLMSESDVGKPLNIHLSGDLSFIELDGFFEARLAPVRRELAGMIFQSIKTRTPLNLEETSKKTGMTKKLIIDIVSEAINANIIQNVKIENEMLIYE
ncbi:MAG: hypothetical protein ACFFD4_24935 [Candidatus Odinarchaeota archaeon]